jgi:hypothetical protein
MLDKWTPWAEKIGDPHLHKCACGHQWVAPLDPSTTRPGPNCTDDDGHSMLDRQSIATARAVIERFGVDVVLNKKM